MKSFRPLAILVVLPILMQSPAHGQKIDLKNAPWIKQVSPLPGGPVPTTRGIKFSYDLTWKKQIKAGSANIVIVPSKNHPGLIAATAQGRSSGAAGKLFPYHFNCKSILNTKDGLRSVNMKMTEETRREKKSTQLKFPDDQVTVNRQVTETKSNKVRKFQRDYFFDQKLAQDAFAVLLGARSQPLKVGQEITSLVVPVDKPYLIKFKVLGRETRRIKRKNYKTIKLDLKIIGRVNNDKSIKPYDKLKALTLWLTDDADRIPLELKADVFVGHFSAYLTSREYLK